MEYIIKGNVAWKFGDYFSGSLIMGREGDLDKNRDPEHLKQYVLKDYVADFHKNFRKGDFMIAGKAFGGSRDHGSIMVLQKLGVSIVIAESFGGVWQRRAISSGLPILECPGITGFAVQGDELEINIKTGQIHTVPLGKKISAEPAIEPQLAILEAGGITEYIKAKLEK